MRGGTVVARYMNICGDDSNAWPDREILYGGLEAELLHQRYCHCPGVHSEQL
jgi:hypothetical protein